MADMSVNFDGSTILALLNIALPLGEDIVRGISSLLQTKFGTQYTQIEAIWAANIAEATKNAEGK